MTSQLMNHEEAISRLAAERYLLGEMKEDERGAFEEHYLSCAACLEAVTFGHDFMEQAQPLARELRTHEGTAKAPARDRDSGNFFSSLLAGLRNPAPAWALVVVLAALATYQASHQQKGAYPESRYILTGIAHGGGDVKELQVLRDSILSLGVEYGRSGEFLSYRARILSDSGAVKSTVAIPDHQMGNTASIALLARTLDPGRYSVVVLGKTVDGTEKEVGRGAFELRFIDK